MQAESSASSSCVALDFRTIIIRFVTQAKKPTSRVRFLLEVDISLKQLESRRLFQRENERKRFSLESDDISMRCWHMVRAQTGLYSSRLECRRQGLRIATKLIKRRIGRRSRKTFGHCSELLLPISYSASPPPFHLMMRTSILDECILVRSICIKNL